MKMPERPETWAALLAWLSAHYPQLYAAGLSFVVALTRVIYGGGTRRQALLEATLCTLITLGLIPVLEWFGLPQNMATAAGVFTGFLGVKKIAEFADRIADWKFPRRGLANEDHRRSTRPRYRLRCRYCLDLGRAHQRRHGSVRDQHG